MIHFIITHDHIKECSISSLAPFASKKCAIPPIAILGSTSQCGFAETIRDIDAGPLRE